MISTQNLTALSDKHTLQKICKAISVLDAIICPEWEYRYYSYNSKWGDDEEVLEMRDGQGDHMFILFKKEGCVINGFAHEYNQQNKNDITIGLPEVLNEFIFGEPITSIGTTFCTWNTDDKNWKIGNVKNHENGSSMMLNILDGNPQAYINWAEDYFEKKIPLNIIQQIYQGKVLTKNMVLSISDEYNSWEELKEDLGEIHYPYNF